MEFSKVDLSSILAISHDGENLGLVLEREDTLELIEIPAPAAAYQGLRQIDVIIASESNPDFNQLLGGPQALPMRPIDSTMANAVGYDPKHHLLQVEFKNGTVYQYEDVDLETWQDFQESDSPGRFFNQEIRGYYRSHRL
jgi:hypothetical protein